MRTRLAEVSAQTIGFDIADLPNIADDGSEVEFEVSATPIKGRYERRPNTKTIQTRNLHESMYQQSQTMRELEHLVLAFDAVEGWVDCVGDLERYVKAEHIIHHEKSKLIFCRSNVDPRQTKGIKAKLEESLDYVTERIDPICNEWLTQPKDGKCPLAVLSKRIPSNFP
jgi:nuclear pore complex protein Nup107